MDDDGTYYEIPDDVMSFPKLLEIAKGNRTQKQYAEDAGISAVQLNNFFKNKLVRMPRKDTLQKLANAAYGKITSDDLYKAARYSIFEGKNSDSTLRMKLASLIRWYADECSDCHCELLDAENFDQGLSTFRIYSEYTDIWQFRYLPLGDNRIKSRLTMEIGAIAQNNYFSLVCNYFENGVCKQMPMTFMKPKISLVIQGANDAKYIAEETCIPAFSFPVSIIGVDLDEYTILSENYIKTGYTGDVELLPSLQQNLLIPGDIIS